MKLTNYIPLFEEFGLNDEQDLLLDVINSFIENPNSERYEGIGTCKNDGYICVELEHYNEHGGDIRLSFETKYYDASFALDVKNSDEVNSDFHVDSTNVRYTLEGVYVYITKEYKAMFDIELEDLEYLIDFMKFNKVFDKFNDKVDELLIMYFGK